MHSVLDRLGLWHGDEIEPDSARRRRPDAELLLTRTLVSELQVPAGNPGPESRDLGRIGTVEGDVENCRTHGALRMRRAPAGRSSRYLRSEPGRRRGRQIRTRHRTTP